MPFTAEQIIEVAAKAKSLVVTSSAWIEWLLAFNSQAIDEYNQNTDECDQLLVKIMRASDFDAGRSRTAVIVASLVRDEYGSVDANPFGQALTWLCNRPTDPTGRVDHDDVKSFIAHPLISTVLKFRQFRPGVGYTFRKCQSPFDGKAYEEASFTSTMGVAAHLWKRTCGSSLRKRELNYWNGHSSETESVETSLVEASSNRNYWVGGYGSQNSVNVQLLLEMIDYEAGCLLSAHCGMEAPISLLVSGNILVLGPPELEGEPTVAVPVKTPPESGEVPNRELKPLDGPSASASATHVKSLLDSDDPKHKSKTLEEARETFKHSPCFTSVNWNGTAFAFTTAQRAVVARLSNAFKNGTSAVSDVELLEAAGSHGKFLRDVFRHSGKEHPAWNTLIVKVGRNARKLSLSNTESHTTPH